MEHSWTHLFLDSLGHIPRSGTAGSYVTLGIIFWGSSKGLPQRLYRFHSHQQGLRDPCKVLSRWGKCKNCAFKIIGTSFCERTRAHLGLVGLTCALKHSSGNIGRERLWLDTQQPQAPLEREYQVPKKRSLAWNFQELSKNEQ